MAFVGSLLKKHAQQLLAMQIKPREQRRYSLRKKRSPMSRRFVNAVLLFALCAPFGSMACRAAGDELPFRLDTGGHTDRIMGLMFVSLSGGDNSEERLVSASVDQSVRMWSPETDTLSLHEGTPHVTPFRYNSDNSGKGEIWSTAYDPIHHWIALGCKAQTGGAMNEKPAEILLIDPKGKVVRSLRGECKDNIRALAFSPKGDYLAVCSVDNVLVYNTTSWQAVQMDARFAGGCAAFDPTGQRLAVGGEKDTIRIYTLQGKKHQDMHLVDGGLQDVQSLVWSKTGYLVAGDVQGRVYGRENGKKDFHLVQHYDLSVSCLALDPDAKYLAIGLSGIIGVSGMIPHQGQIEIITLADGSSRRATLNTHYPVTSLAFSGDGKTLANGDAAGIIQMWDWSNSRKTESVKDLAGSGRSIYHLAWTSDGNTLAWSGDSATPQPTLSFNLKDMRPGGLPDDDAFAPPTQQLNIPAPNKIASLGSITIKSNSSILQGIFYEPHQGIDNPHPRAYVAIAEPATVLGYDVSDPKNPRLTSVYGGYSGVVNTLSVSPNGKYLAVGTADQVVRVWSVTDPAQKADAEHPAHPLISLFVGQDQQWVAWNQETGFYTSSEWGDDIINYQINDLTSAHQATVVPVSICREPFYNPLCMMKLFQSATAQTVYDLKNTLPGKESVEQWIQHQPIIDQDHVVVRELAQNEDLQKDTDSDRRITFKDQVFLKVPIKGEGTVAQDRLKIQNTNTGRTIQGKYATPTSSSATTLPEGYIQVPLQPGLNTLRIVAASRDGKINSQPYTLQVEYRGAAVKQGALHVLAIGASSYPNLPENKKLHYADKDAEAIGNLFLQQKGIKDSLYTDVDVTILPNEKASREGVREALAALKAKSKPEDTLVFFLAGHGEQPQDVNVKDPDYYFIPNDFKFDDDPDSLEKRAVSWKYLIRELTDVKAVHKFLFIDHCFAGGVNGLVSNEQSAVALRATTTTIRNLADGTFITFMASAAGETSKEHVQWGHGAFTYALLDILSGRDLNLRKGTDRIVTVLDIKYAIKSKVKALLNNIPELKDKIQTPELQKVLPDSSILDLPIVKLP